MLDGTPAFPLEVFMVAEYFHSDRAARSGGGVGQSRGRTHPLVFFQDALPPHPQRPGSTYHLECQRALAPACPAHGHACRTSAVSIAMQPGQQRAVQCSLPRTPFLCPSGENLVFFQEQVQGLLDPRRPNKWWLLS